MLATVQDKEMLKRWVKIRNDIDIQINWTTTGNIFWKTNSSPNNFYLQGTNVVTFSVFWLFSALYLFVDFTGRPKWALQYKIQDGSNQPVSYLSSHNFLGVSNGKFRTS